MPETTTSPAKGPPTMRAIKAAYISRQMKAYGKIPSPRVVEGWLDEFGRLPDVEKLAFYSRLNFLSETPR